MLLYSVYARYSSARLPDHSESVSSSSFYYAGHANAPYFGYTSPSTTNAGHAKIHLVDRASASADNARLASNSRLSSGPPATFSSNLQTPMTPDPQPLPPTKLEHLLTSLLVQTLSTPRSYGPPGPSPLIPRIHTTLDPQLLSLTA